MSENRSAIAIPHNAHAAIVEAIQLAIIDKGASKATRGAAFAALLALIDAGSVVGNTSAPQLADANRQTPQAA